jgi:arylsulfatase A-like enzyme
VPAPLSTQRVATSTPTFVTYPAPPPGAPNIVLVVLDDVGFGQLGCFGGPIATPNLDALAAGGVRCNRFHVTSVCSSTRACLLTGRNHHAVGMGLTQESALGFPGYTGRIPRSAATAARILRDGGYNTMAVGKWHLTAKGEYSAAGPFARWPLGLGFERYYGFLGAETNQWAPELVRDNTHVDPPRSPRGGYHLTEDLVDEAIRMVQNQQEAAARKPFFLYLATGAAHAPHHVAEEWATSYRGAFDGGWEHYRERVYERQLAEGIIPAGTALTPRPSWLPAWDERSAAERRLFARYMEVFAGFMAHTDHHLGRLFDDLGSRGILDDTLALVCSDNGASAEGGTRGARNESAAWLGHVDDVDDALAHADEIGGHRAFNHYPLGWAWAGNAPFRLWKRYAWLGGTRTPLIALWPQAIVDTGSVRAQFCHAVDVYATVLDAAGIEQPAVVDGVTQQPVDGRSLLPVLRDPAAEEIRRLQYFELAGSRGIYCDGWKATTDHVANQFGERSLIEGSYDFETDRWSLFNLDDDFSEAHDRADDEPERVRALEQLWWSEAGRNNVLPLFEFPASMAHMHPGEFPSPPRAEYRPGGGPIVESQLPAMFGGFVVETEIEVPAGGVEGVVCALGDRFDGWAFYFLDGRPVCAASVLGASTRAIADHPISPGAHRVAMRYETRPAGRLVLSVDDVDVAEAAQTQMMFFPGVSTAGGGLLVGRDRGFAINDDYEPPFPFTGTLRRVVMQSGAPAARPDDATEASVALRAD